MTKATLLHRQVNPSWVQAGRITSQVFKPTPKDNKRVSVYDGDMISAADAWKHFTQRLKYKSVGVVAVNVSECDQLDLPVTPDTEPFPEHVVIVFDDFSTSQIEKKAKKLKAAADVRGWQYQADSLPH